MVRGGSTGTTTLGGGWVSWGPDAKKKRKKKGVVIVEVRNMQCIAIHTTSVESIAFSTIKWTQFSRISNRNIRL